MISFYPGPSRVHDEIPVYVEEAFREGVLSINHRSDEFMQISEKTVSLLKQRLNIPAAYSVLFASSATECWEIIAQSLVTQNSYHLYNGAFGEKWLQYTGRIRAGAKGFKFDIEEQPDPEKTMFAPDGVICVTQNETSNGTQVMDKTLQAIRQRNPRNLLAVDATSSMAGIDLDFNAADIWFASVQKCFGLPAGLAVMACSPRATESAKNIGENLHYNSLTFMSEMMGKWQTPCTPNVLNIYLLMRVMENSKPVAAVHQQTKKRYDQWMTFLTRGQTLRHLVHNGDVHSFTVVPVTAAPELISTIKSEAKKAGFLLGEGYGQLKSSTFRIANFPAIRESEIESLQHFLRQFL